ncbi:unnamed protein product [Rotaria sp. Silwood1]|nr:unnamed protein product [Rotaria sp. Silwood1]
MNETDNGSSQSSEPELYRYIKLYLFELPITLQFLRVGYVKPNVNSFCLFWIWYNFSLQSTNLFLMTWTSFQRHILIFHSNWTQTNIGKIKSERIDFL